MPITFKNIKPSEKAVKMLSWENVSFNDGQEDKYPVKKLVLTIEAGNMAEVMVERYLPNGTDDLVYNAISKGYTCPATIKNYYYVENSEVPIEISVSGPKRKQKTQKKINKERLKEMIKKNYC